MVGEIDKPKVSIVVLHWKNFDDTLACLKSISNLTFQPDNIIIVDNHSDDFCVQKVKNLLPSSLIIKSERNLGYSGGNNLGIRYALENEADYIWILNNDIIVDGDALYILVDIALENSNAGFLGPKILTQEDPSKILSTGGILQSDGKAYHIGIGESDNGQFNEINEADFLSGSSFMVGRNVIEKIGLLDEDFFAYHEDIDWCYRARQAGFKILNVPRAIVFHPDTRIRDENSALVTYYITRNSLLFARKTRLGSCIFACMFLNHIRTLMSWSLRPRWRYKREQRDALARGLLDFIRSRFGQAQWI